MSTECGSGAGRSFSTNVYWVILPGGLRWDLSPLVTIILAVKHRRQNLTLKVAAYVQPPRSILFAENS